MPANGHHLVWEEILPNLTLDDNIHFCPTRVISLENTLAGTVFPQAEIIRISEEAHKLGIIMHLEYASFGLSSRSLLICYIVVRVYGKSRQRPA